MLFNLTFTVGKFKYTEEEAELYNELPCTYHPVSLINSWPVLFHHYHVHILSLF